MPLSPLFVKARGLDVIVAVDASSDDSNFWPKYVFKHLFARVPDILTRFSSGTAMTFTSNRLSTILASSHQPFPPIPSSFEEFVSTGVRGRPTFFGCYPYQNPPEFPLVISLPSTPPIDGSNPVTK